jgi:hypothetical protein
MRKKCEKSNTSLKENPAEYGPGNDKKTLENHCQIIFETTIALYIIMEQAYTVTTTTQTSYFLRINSYHNINSTSLHMKLVLRSCS